MEKETKVAAVSMKNITKTFGSVIANDKVNLDIYKGEILSLLGENGSGKTTLMNMLSGIYFPDEGQIFINGKEEVIRSPKDALRLGIGMVHQHFKLIDVLSATENIILGLEGGLNIKEASRKIEEICNKYGFEVDPKQKIYDMSVSQKQTVEIVKVLYRGADILILDEPTAVLTPQETEKLFNVLRKMRDDGKAIVIITHKMHEVESLSDRVAVLRNGQYIGSMLTKDTTVTEMTNMMVGHAVTLNIERPEPVNPKPRIEVEGLTVRNEEGIVKLKDVSFTANSGEILGIAGISGCGQKELLEAIAGLQVVETGTIHYVEDDGSKEMLIGKYGKEEANKRIYATTDKAKGALKNLANEEGYESFVVPDDVGGRFSVLTAVGLLPIAVSGADIDALMTGAADARKVALETEYEKNPALLYAAVRNILLRKGKQVEIVANYEPSLHYVSEWWKQLFGESEGKDQRGIFPAAVDLTTDLHSMGQFIQDGARIMFETVLNVEESPAEIVLQKEDVDTDGMNYLAGKTVDFVNKSAMNGTILAHTDGSVPNLMVKIPAQDAYSLGQLFYFFEFACGVSGYILGVNPFNQPGVESYKKNMFALLGKPGYEEAREALLKRL